MTQTNIDLFKKRLGTKKIDFLALSETGRSNFATPFLNHLACGLDSV